MNLIRVTSRTHVTIERDCGKRVATESAGSDVETYRAINEGWKDKNTMRAKVQMAEIVTEHMEGTCPVVTAAVCNVQHDKVRQTSWIQTFRSLCVRWLNVFQRLNLLCHPPPSAPYLGLIPPRAFITKLSNDHGPPDCSLLAFVVPPPSISVAPRSMYLFSYRNKNPTQESSPPNSGYTTERSSSALATLSDTLRVICTECCWIRLDQTQISSPNAHQEHEFLSHVTSDENSKYS